MKYVNAEHVLPKSLLEEIQKYIQGDLVYIPKPQASYKKWGHNTGAKKTLAQRNKNIIEGFKAGDSISHLADLHSLAENTVKKIVYAKC
ncbi:MAG: CD3324 family protein [Defluviitaleaceae bacterium]|nr:CD3324 family protein [Defluviitaleaceae bacterium]